MADRLHIPAPLGGKLWTPFTVSLAALVVLATVILLVRFAFGLGAVTNVNDGFPWGIWVVYDVVIGSAFACGGYTMALLVYIFNKGEYHPLVRPALMASLFGYTLAGLGVLFDLGRWWNFWHIFWPGYANVNSVMFEVAACISLYILVMWIEFSPAFLDRFGLGHVKKKVTRWMFFFIALGVLLPSMHQSSLGSLLVVFGKQIHPLWQAGWLLPLLFLMTALLLGFALVIFESTLVAVLFRRPPETALLGRMAKFMWGLLVAYLVVRLGDLVLRGAILSAFGFTQEALWFWLEMIAFAVPVWLLAKPADRANPGKLFGAAALLMAGGFLLRINAFLVGYETGDGWSYFPALPELVVTLGLIAFEVLGYIIFVKSLPVLPRVAGQAN
jgi:Ni/Fe-hydrogenase subunit HybB-like protein